jgi:hypothetical protein
MMGPTKLTTIRAEIRKAFKMSDVQLLAWFNRQLSALDQRPKVNKAEINALRLLRDAIIGEVKRGRSRRAPSRMSGRSKR